MGLADALGLPEAAEPLGREEQWASGVSELLACLDESSLKAPRGSGGFEALAEKRRSQRRRQAEKVVAQRISSSRAVAEAHGALGRFLDKRAGSVQEASCAASDAQGRLQRLQEQSKGARAVALRNAQAQVADAEQRALQEARTRQAMLDRREAEVEALKQITSSLNSRCKTCAGDLRNISRTLEAAAGQASDVRHEKRLVQDRCLSLDAREAALLTLESAWREVARSNSARSPRKALDAAREHLSRELLRDKVFMDKVHQLLDRLPQAAAPQEFTSPASDVSIEPGHRPASEAKEGGASADSTADAGDLNGDHSVAWSPVNGSAASQGKEETATLGALADVSEPVYHDEDPNRARSPVPRSVTAPPRRLGRWPSSKSFTRMTSPTRIVVQTLPPTRFQSLGDSLGATTMLPSEGETPVSIAQRPGSKSQQLSATLPLQVVIAHERGGRKNLGPGHDKPEPVRFVSANASAVVAHERGRKNLGQESRGEHLEAVRFISASGSHRREYSLETPPAQIPQASYRATSSDGQPKTPQMPCRTSQARYQTSPQPRQAHHVIQPQPQPAQPLVQSPQRYPLLGHQPQSPQHRVQYFSGQAQSYAPAMGPIGTTPMVVPRLPGANLTVLPPQTVVWPGQR